jgi:hypothetical protein
MTNISEAQSATCRKVEKHLINYSAGEVTKASSSTVVLGPMSMKEAWGNYFHSSIEVEHVRRFQASSVPLRTSDTTHTPGKLSSRKCVNMQIREYNAARLKVVRPRRKFK